MIWASFSRADDLDQELGKKLILERFQNPNLLLPLYNDPAVYNVDVYNMGLFYYEGIYIGLPAFYHATGPIPNYPNTDGFHLIQLVSSRDLKNWKRHGNRETFIGPSHIDSGAYDLTQILPPSAPVLRGDELWFYYTGLKWRSVFDYNGTFPDGSMTLKHGRDKDGGAVCLAVLRRDGFISIDGGENGGSLVTKPFPLPEGDLHVNLDAYSGEAIIEMLDSKGELIAYSKPLTGDLPNQAITWENEFDLKEQLGQTVSLRFQLINASLYSYWFGSDRP
ncbi:MAG: hypothetical protein R3C11_06225 [Planctomycetaceae bacterium]